MVDTRCIALAVNAVDPHPNHQAVFAGVMEYAREMGNWECFIDEHPLLQARKRRKARGGYDGIIARADPAMQRRAGFGNEGVMSRTFKAAFGTSPGVYRKQEEQDLT